MWSARLCAESHPDLSHAHDDHVVFARRGPGTPEGQQPRLEEPLNEASGEQRGEDDGHEHGQRGEDGVSPAGVGRRGPDGRDDTRRLDEGLSDPVLLNENQPAPVGQQNGAESEQSDEEEPSSCVVVPVSPSQGSDDPRAAAARWRRRSADARAVLVAPNLDQFVRIQERSQ